MTKVLFKSVTAVPNIGEIETDNSPNYAYINQSAKAMKVVKEAFQKDPSSVTFYTNFVYIDGKCYNGIRKKDVIGE